MSWARLINLKPYLLIVVVIKVGRGAKLLQQNSKEKALKKLEPFGVLPRFLLWGKRLRLSYNLFYLFIYVLHIFRPSFTYLRSLRLKNRNHIRIYECRVKLLVRCLRNVKEGAKLTMDVRISVDKRGLY